MARARRSTVGDHLFVVFMATFFVAPLGVGQMTVENWSGDGWVARSFTIAVVALVIWLLVRSFIGLARVASRGFATSDAVALVVLGGILLLFSYGPLLESERLSTKPVGAMFAIVGVSFIAIACIGWLRRRAAVEPTVVSRGSEA